ncbi:hypothetical protein [Anaeromyxobacter paludicola]|uniref:DUF885 domain-containing protein n=1 Tax=Anaeromyxobacter paludicola TaxID=2918171 RepID=A0ABN6NF81_9BACT|nr:hypothetical protein [Anaeromyxobacter paludicola]BDG10693.1 hypothetical protein AMPC_38060 [Anaeromyxobacter paludicola]
MRTDAELSQALATAVLGIDTLWGGDVMNPSGAGRFIADSWFSDEPLPAAYTHPAAAALRQGGGVSADAPDLAAVDAYLAAVDLPGAIEALAAGARGAAAQPGQALRGAYLAGLAETLRAMWDLSQERLGRGPAVPFARTVEASTGKPPEPSRPGEKLERVRELLDRAGHPARDPAALLAAADAWRAERKVPSRSIPMLGAAFIAELEAGTARHVVPFLPPRLRQVPLANVAFVSIADAWFSGSMNYLGRARTAAGQPLYESTYEVNARLEISVPEFAQLVSHEVVPGHVTTFALLQAGYVQGALGFESTLLTMNTRGAALSEGIANNALLMAHGVVDVSELADPDLRLGMLLSLLQDDAKNQAAWLTWAEGADGTAVARTLREQFLCSAERAEKLAIGWARHPLLGRMYLPAYRAGTERVAELRRRHPPEQVIPALFGARGMVDVVTVEAAITGELK